MEYLAFDSIARKSLASILLITFLKNAKKAKIINKLVDMYDIWILLVKIYYFF